MPKEKKGQTQNRTERSITNSSHLGLGLYRGLFLFLFLFLLFVFCSFLPTYAFFSVFAVFSHATHIFPSTTMKPNMGFVL